MMDLRSDPRIKGDRYRCIYFYKGMFLCLDLVNIDLRFAVIKISTIFISTLLCISSILFATQTSAEEAKPVLKFISGDWDEYANKDGTGIYSEVVQMVFNVKYTVQIFPVPWARAQKGMMTGEYVGLVGENASNPCCVIPFVFLDKSPLKAYAKKGKYKKFLGLDTLKTHKTGWVKGYAYDRLVPEVKLNFVEVVDAPSGFKMLKAGRIDSLVEYESDYEKNMKVAKLPLNSFDAFESGISEDIHVAFKKSPEGDNLRQMWDDRMRELFNNGELKKIFEKYKVNFPHSKSIVNNRKAQSKS